MLRKHWKVGTFEGLFESSTFVYALSEGREIIGHVPCKIPGCVLLLELVDISSVP